MINKKAAIIILLFLIIDSRAHSQSYWAKSYDGGYDEYACCADVVNDGLIIAANMKQIVYYPWIIKINKDGDILWQKILYNDGDYVTSIRAISANIYISAGYNKRTKKYWIVRINEKGEILWKKIYDSQPTYSSNIPKSFILPVSSGGFLFLTDNGNIWKLNNDGNAQWKKKIILIADWDECDFYLSSANESIMSYFLLGKALCWSHHGNADEELVFIAKIDKNGEPIWSRNIRLPENMSIESTIPNNILVYGDGSSISVIEVIPREEKNNIIYGLKKILLIKINKLGEIEWQKIISPQNLVHLSGFNIIKSNSNANNVIISASLDSLQESYLIELDLSGNINKIKSFSGNKIVILPDLNGYYVVGSTSLFSSNLSDVWVIKINNNYNISDNCSLINDSSLLINEMSIDNYFEEDLLFYKLDLKPQEVSISSKDTYSKALTKCYFESNVENPPSNSFSFQCSPQILLFPLGISKCYFYPKDNFKGKAYLSCENLPQNAFCSFTPAEVDLNNEKAEAILTIKRTSSLKSGTYSFYVVAKSGNIEKKYLMELMVGEYSLPENVPE